MQRVINMIEIHMCPVLYIAPVTSVSFSRDDQCVLASTLDNKIRLFDKDTGELLNE